MYHDVFMIQTLTMTVPANNDLCRPARQTAKNTNVITLMMGDKQNFPKTSKQKS